MHGMDGGFSVAALKKILKFAGYLFLLTIFLVVIRCNIERNKLRAEVIENDSSIHYGLYLTKTRIDKVIPLMVDKDRRLDRFDYKDKDAFVDYTFINYSKNEFFQKYDMNIINEIFKNRACDDPLAKKYLNQDLSFNINHYGNDGKLISSFKVDKHSCNAIK